MGHLRSRHHGFSLVELLAVITIIVIVTAFALPSIPAMSAAGKMNEATSEIAGILEQARQFAAAQNTYVWVTFSTSVSNNIDQLSVTTVASTDGTDPGSYGTVPSTNFNLISKVRTFSQIELKTAGTFTSAQMPGLPTTPTVSSANALSTASVFSIVLPGTSAPATFGQSVQFTPSGEARNGSSPIDLIEFDLEPAQVTAAPNPRNAAVVRINGVTGQALVYRM